MTDQEDKSAYDYDLALKRMADRRLELKSVRGRRFHACRDVGRIRDVIDELPDSSRKNELLNLANTLLRLIILENDGGPVSPSQVNPF